MFHVGTESIRKLARQREIGERLPKIESESEHLMFRLGDGEKNRETNEVKQRF